MVEKAPSRMNKAELREMNKRLTEENVRLQTRLRQKEGELEHAWDAELRFEMRRSQAERNLDALTAEFQELSYEKNELERGLRATQGRLKQVTKQLQEDRSAQRIMELEEERDSYKNQYEECMDTLLDIRDKVLGRGY